MNEQIGAKLRRVYEDVAAEPVPDRFADLLRQLGEKTEEEEKTSDRAADQRHVSSDSQ
ncbi:MAG: NepR family anti-sigma factor [Pseudomonadota bacterium]